MTLFWKKSKLDQKPAEMPQNWDDFAGWDSYYAGQIPNNRVPTLGTANSHLFTVMSQSVPGFMEKGRKTWFPGCGLSVMPGVYAALGLDVVATDASQIAIDIQRFWLPSNEWPGTLLREVGLTELAATIPNATGSLDLGIHDFRKPMAESDFDRIINVKSIQGLSESSMRSAASVHFNALRAGGDAIFVTQNVQGKRRILLESVLADAGFFVPYFRANQWHLESLLNTGIEFNMILGYPKARMVSTESKRKADQEKIDSYQDEWFRRLEDEQTAVQAACADGVSKVAQLIHNTG